MVSAEYAPARGGVQEIRGAVYHPFGQGGGKMLAQAYGVPFLGMLPLDGAVRQASDEGFPIIAIGNDKQKAAYGAMVDALLAVDGMKKRLARE